MQISRSTQSIGASLAKQGLRAMYQNNVSGGQEQGLIGDSYLSGIAEASDVPAEIGVAEVAGNSNDRVKTWRAQVAVADVAMSTIAGGVSGPIGPIIAKVGRESMFSHILRDGQDQGTIGEVFVAGIATESSNETEQILSKTALKASSWVAKWRGQVAVAESTLSAVADGVTGPVGSVLAGVGYDAIYSDHISTVQDQARVGLTFTQAVADHTEDPGQRARARAALRSSDRVDTARSQVAILGEFLRSDA